LLQQANIKAILQDMDEVDDVQVVHLCALYSNLYCILFSCINKVQQGFNPNKGLSYYQDDYALHIIIIIVS
jgi:hypothetical protein